MREGRAAEQFQDTGALLRATSHSVELEDLATDLLLLSIPLKLPLRR